MEHKNVDDIAYPIVADPTVKFGNWFSSSKWVWRANADYKRSLELTPTARLRGVAAATYMGGIGTVASNASVNASWTAVYNKYHNSSYWKHTTGMKRQYICHFYFAFAKKTFHLEPNRPERSMAATIKAACNPK